MSIFSDILKINYCNFANKVSALKNSKLVHIGSSEETPQEISLCSNDSHIKGFSVAFDPLDGSSIVDCNFAVGTICGIWEGKRLLGQKYKDMICVRYDVGGWVCDTTP